MLHARAVVLALVLGLTAPAWSACVDAFALVHGDAACAMPPASKTGHDCGEAGGMVQCCLESTEQETRFTPLAKPPSDQKPLLPCAGFFARPGGPAGGPVSAAASGAYALEQLKLPHDPAYLRFSAFLI